MSEVTGQQGKVMRIVGPVVTVVGLRGVRLYDVVYVGDKRLIGEVIRLSTERVTVQVYEDTIGLAVGEPVISSGQPLQVTLGPGLLGEVFDGLQRPLANPDQIFLRPGETAASLSTEKRWLFTPKMAEGERVQAGDVIGEVPETVHLMHQLLVPPGIRGQIVYLQPQAELTVVEPVAQIRSETGQLHELTLQQQWPVRRERPYRRKYTSKTPLITGTRILDSLFPIAKGGTAIIPGGFGTGKTIAEQSLARWADVDVVIYIGCGERGNEMAELLTEFPHLEDPRYGTPLMARTILIANTSNMPVAAREASIYTGITLAEYYRDMGYDVLLLADSTSRWGEALREISSRLEEMPGEEGYPAYLGARLAEFYERAGQVDCLYGDEATSRSGSITIVGAVSPPGGDFSEPVTQNSLRIVGAFWALDYDLSRRRHFPAINWLQSYSLYSLQDWYQEQFGERWNRQVQKAMGILQEEADLLEIVQLVGPDALAPKQRLLLTIARILREDFLQQSSLDPVDRYCPLAKTEAMLISIITFYDWAITALASGTSLNALLAAPILQQIAQMKALPVDTADETLTELITQLKERI